MGSYWDEYKRWLPAALMAIVLLVTIVVLVTGSSETVEHPIKVVPKKSTLAIKKKAEQNPVGGAASVTPQSTEQVSGAHDSPVPILMYHVTKAAPAGTPYPELWVSPADFRGQMQWLADNGYTGITMAQLFKYWDQGFKLPDKPVVISFDDGYPSHEKVARPVLASHHWPGVLFLELSNVDSPETGLTSAMIKKLIAAGWELGSHTITHPDLTTVGPGELEREVAGSKEKIAAKFGAPIDFFCYPAGKYDESVVAAVKRAGYKGAVTVDEGLATPDQPFKLKRVRIDGDDGVDGFAAKMRQSDQ